MVSLGVIIYLIARSAPRVTEVHVLPQRDNYLDKLAKKIPLEKMDAIASSLLEKFLRRLKVLILKLDNLLGNHLKNLRSNNDHPDQPSIFDKKEDSTLNK